MEQKQQSNTNYPINTTNNTYFEDDLYTEILCLLIDIEEIMKRVHESGSNVTNRNGIRFFTCIS